MPLFRIGLPCISVCKLTALCQFMMELNGYTFFCFINFSFSSFTGGAVVLTLVLFNLLVAPFY